MYYIYLNPIKLKYVEFCYKSIPVLLKFHLTKMLSLSLISSLHLTYCGLGTIYCPLPPK